MRGIAAVGYDPERKDGEKGHQQRCQRQLVRLPRRQREAVFLRVIADLPEDEVARVMGCSVGSVKTHKSRGLAQLRDLFDDGEEVSGGYGTATEAAHG